MKRVYTFSMKEFYVFIESMCHIVFWVCLGYFFLRTSILRPFTSIRYEMIILLVIIFICYLNFFVLYPYFFKRNKILYFLLVLFCLSGAVGFEVLFVYPTIRQHYNGIPAEVYSEIISFSIFGIAIRDFILLNYFMFYKLYKDARNSYRLEKEKAQIEREKQLVEIENLKSKVAPHFLFNNLDKIRNNIESDPKTASEKVVAMASLLRAILDAKKSTVPIANEVKFIENLIKLENDHRYTNLDLQFTSYIEDPEQKIAPLLFEGFISNAFKFVMRDNGYIHIDLQLKRVDENNKLIFTCRNNIGKKESCMVSTCNGIDNIKQRLDLIYPENEFVIVETTVAYNVYLEIEL